MAVLLTAASIMYVSYADSPVLLGGAADEEDAVVEGFAASSQASTSSQVQETLRVALAVLERGASVAEVRAALRGVHLALSAKYSRHADAKVAGACGLLALKLFA